MFCWETLGFGIHVDVTMICTTKQDNTPHATSKYTQWQLEEHNKYTEITIPVQQHYQNPIPVGSHC